MIQVINLILLKKIKRNQDNKINKLKLKQIINNQKLNKYQYKM